MTIDGCFSKIRDRFLEVVGYKGPKWYPAGQNGLKLAPPEPKVHFRSKGEGGLGTVWKRHNWSRCFDLAGRPHSKAYLGDSWIFTGNKLC